MPGVHKPDRNKYLPKNYKIIKYGKAIRLPKIQIGDGDGYTYNGVGFMDFIRMLSANKDTIQNVAGAVGSVANTAGTVVNTTLDTIKKIQELKEKENVIRETHNGKAGIPESHEGGARIGNDGNEGAPILKSKPVKKIGSGFFYLNSD